MKTGMFLFDGPLYKDINGDYCNVTLTNEMFNRYFNVVDKLYVVVRTMSVDKDYHELHMKKLDTENMEIVEVPNLNSICGMLKEKNSFRRMVHELLKKTDLIFARMPSVICNIALKEAIAQNKPYLVEVGGCAWDSYWNHGILGKALAPLLFMQEKKYIYCADYAIYVTKFFLQKRYPTKGKKINCSNVYIKDYDVSILEKRKKRLSSIMNRRIILGTAANSIDVKYKGEHLVIDVLPKLLSLGYDVEYQIVGSGKGDFLKRRATKNNVTDRVHLLGTMTKPEIEEWYKNIDIYIQPSKQEGLPRSVIEAMSSGCASLGSRIAGIPELLTPDEMFNPDDSMTIIRAIKKKINVENLLNTADRNFYKAKEYNLTDIEKRRQTIFREYETKILKKK